VKVEVFGSRAEQDDTNTGISIQAMPWRRLKWLPGI